MKLLEVFFPTPEKKVTKAIGVLTSAESQQDNDEKKGRHERIHKKAIEIVEKYPYWAASKASDIIKNPKLDGCSPRKGVGTANLILAMSNVSNSDWIMALSEAIRDKRPLVANAAEIVLSDMVKSGNREALKVIAGLICDNGIWSKDEWWTISPVLLSNISNLFLDEISIDKSLQGKDTIRQAFNYLLESSDLKIRERAQSMGVTPENVSDKYIKELIRKIKNDKCDRANGEDVLEYQEAVDELARLINDHHIELLEPLLSHKYWRVRKHGVMVTKISISRIKTPKYKKLLKSYIKDATNDPDDTVRWVAESFF